MFIASLQKRGSSGEGFTVRLSEGSSFFVSAEFLSSSGFSVNRELDEDQLQLLREEDQRIQALRKAGDLLARAEQSSGGLYLKLKKKGFSDAVCRNVVDRVVEMGLLDDERFASFWIEARLRHHPEGRNVLYQGLLARGVNGECAKNALAKTVTEEDLHDAVLKAGRKLQRRYGDNQEKLRMALMRRGFSGPEIRYYFNSL